MRLCNPFEKIMDPEEMDRDIFIWPQQGETGVEIVYTLSGSQIPQVLGTLEYKGWVEHFPIKVDWGPEVRDLTRIKIKPGILPVSQVSLEVRHGSWFSIRVQDGNYTACVLVIDSDSLKGETCKASARTGDGVGIRSLGFSTDSGQFMYIHHR